MSFLDTLRKNMKAEQFTAMMDAVGDDFDWDVVPRSRLNKVIKQRNELRAQLAGAPQPQGGKSNDDDDDDNNGGTPPAPQGGKPADPPVDVKELEKQWQKRQDDAVQAIKIQYAALQKLRDANAIDAELIWDGKLIDASKLTLDDKGQLTGFDEQLTELQKNKSHLFKQGGAPGGTGKDGGTPPKSVSTREEFLALSAEDQIKFKQANPTLFQQFLEQY